MNINLVDDWLLEAIKKNIEMNKNIKSIDCLRYVIKSMTVVSLQQHNENENIKNTENIYVIYMKQGHSK